MPAQWLHTLVQPADSESMSTSRRYYTYSIIPRKRAWRHRNAVLKNHPSWASMLRRTHLRLECVVTMSDYAPPANSRANGKIDMCVKAKTLCRRSATAWSRCASVSLPDALALGFWRRRWGDFRRLHELADVSVRTFISNV